MKLLRTSVTILLLAASAAAQGADNLALGKMWTFENPPLAYLKQEYGFEPNQAWFDSLRLGALRLGERENPWCSASFVSPQGLIMTNHHCVRDKIAQIQQDKEWVANGFAAVEMTDEVPIPGLTVHQLVEQTNVTADIEKGIGDGDDATVAAEKRKANIAALMAAADNAHPDSMHQVVALYEGAVHQLYRYRVYDDLRLVVAPHLQTAHFGGDHDNFTYPRWSIDFSFLRAYQDGKPADTKECYFRWRAQGALENDLVLVPGNPGDTNRQMTVAQLESQRDIEYPLILGQLGNGCELLRPYAADNPGILTTLLSWENSKKAIAGMLDGLRDDALMAKKRAHEEHFQKAVDADPELKAKFGNVWKEMAALMKAHRALEPKAHFHSSSYIGTVERGVLVAKAFDSTLAEDVRNAAREEALAMKVGGNPLTAALVLDHFTRATKWLPTDDPYLAAVAGDQKTEAGVDWQAAVKRLDKSKLRQTKFVKTLLEADDGAAQFAASDDPAVVVARALWPLMRSEEKEQTDVAAAIQRQGILIGRALHAVYGARVSPDATMTLRFSDGRVVGYPYDGTIAPWATTFYGLYGRTIEFGGAHPFDLPKPWRDAEAKVDLAKKVCFVSTNDIVGGNSGSCVVDKDLRVVGLIFDGNIESLPNDFYYTQEKARAVSVHTDAIVEALQHVYGMGRVVDELRAGAK